VKTYSFQDEGQLLMYPGAVGVEVAAELKLTHPFVSVTLVHSRGLLLSSEPLPNGFKKEVENALKRQGVNIIPGKRAVEVTTAETNCPLLTPVALDDGTYLYPGLVISTIEPVVPNTSYLPDHCLDPLGYVSTEKNFKFQPLKEIKTIILPLGT
jgi:hypothetical protein